MTSGSTALIPSMTAIEPRPVVAERSALESDLESLHAESWGWALSCCARDRDLAEDVLQTAYLRILSGRARFGGKSSFKTWVFGVIRMIARSEKRRAWLWSSRHRRSDAALDVPDSARRADANVEDAERAERLARALARLSDRQREVLQLAFYHDLTIEDAARVMEVSVGSARTHYDRGKKALARLLTAEDIR
jgi:RNA polymerase sigma-70 factor (ECF subfamily)